MKEGRHLSVRILLLAAVAVALVAGHGIILYFAASHMALPVVAVSGIIILIVIGHRGLFGPWYALLRRKCRNDAG